MSTDHGASLAVGGKPAQDSRHAQPVPGPDGGEVSGSVLEPTPGTQAPVAYRVAVRALCEFTAKCGDLDLRFTPSPTAQEGIAGHALVGASRGAGYEREIRLSGRYRDLEVVGRADGYDPAQNTLEEIKTFRGELSRQPANHRELHWAQAKVYAWLLCAARGLSDIQVALVYFDVVSQRQTRLVQACDADSLRAFFEASCERFVTWAHREAAHRRRRDEELAALRFLYPAFRTGQRELAEAVYRAARDGHCLMAQAPTGIGKTLGTVFPQLKAFAGGKLDKLFFLTAKTPGRRTALDALGRLRSGGAASLRVLELVARDKACEHPDKACHGDSCPLANGFYDRLPEARSAAVTQAQLDGRALRDIAREHAVCPYYLSQELVRWADVIVGDYNYYFDHGALLAGLTQANAWRVCVLVDEAHNLLERARMMYGAELDQRRLAQARAVAPPGLKTVLQRVARRWNALNRAQGESYAVQPGLPQPLLEALQQAVVAMSEHAVHEVQPFEPDLQQLYFDAMRFCRLAEHFGEHSFVDLDLAASPLAGKRGQAQTSTVCLRNVVPAPFLQARFEMAHSAVLFSGTLSPGHFHAALLGMPSDTPWLEVASPFHADQLHVRIARHISTRYQDRAASIEPIVALMSAQYAARPGNYLAFFSSFDYLQQVLASLGQRHPQIPVWTQVRNMPEAERGEFLARFTCESRGIGFAVLGGAFAEGVDLPGDRLIGAFIATLGLPQVNPVNEEIRERLQQRFGAGYDYAYLYPGLQKVVQAAGRVIRSPQDSGIVHLMDDRFARPAVRQLMPDWWSPRLAGRAAAIARRHMPQPDTLAQGDGEW